MKFLKLKLSVILLIVTFNANSAVIVDTGAGPDPFPGNAWGFGGYNKFSGQFTLTENTSLNAIAGWMGVDGYGIGLDFNILVYTEINGLPGEALYAATVFVPPPSNVTPENAYGFDWYGVSGLAWNLAAGNYWVSFEGIVNDLQTTAIMPGPSQIPLTYYATNDATTGNQWRSADYLDLGVKIDGTPAIVPIPASIWLFISGIAGLISFGRHHSIRKS